MRCLYRIDVDYERAGKCSGALRNLAVGAAQKMNISCANFIFNFGKHYKRGIKFILENWTALLTDKYHGGTC
jgi:hypothetical protein